MHTALGHELEAPAQCDVILKVLDKLADRTLRMKILHIEARKNSEQRTSRTVSSYTTGLCTAPRSSSAVIHAYQLRGKMVALSSCARTHPSQDCLILDGWTERHSSPLWLSVGEHVRYAKLVLAFIHC